ncbi:MAG: dihydroorotate dehydrogenase-like protein [Acidimicrobiales bacterium]|jgi:dihydroorotate dehydrogenase (fumarate)
MPGPNAVNLETSYLGLELSSPIVASAGPLTGDVDSAKALADAGVGAIVLPSLFEEEIVAEEVGLASALEAGSEHFAEALHYFPEVSNFTSAADRYLELLETTKKAVHVPVIASLNGSSSGGWVRYAELLNNAGADALELNVYRVPTDGALSAAQVEEADLALIASVCENVSLPVAVKLSPYYSAMVSFASDVIGAGASGLVLFNRFYQPDLDLEKMDVVPKVELSRTFELRLPLRWIAILRPQLGNGASLAATSGIQSGADVLKALAVGANVAMMTSSLLRLGPSHVSSVESEMRSWLADHEYASVDELRGSVSRETSDDAGAFERANYLKTLHSWTTPSRYQSAGLD